MDSNFLFTFSSILDPGEVPEIRGVTRFPGQAKVGGDSKIPTILYYDQQGNVCAAGDEANEEGIEQLAEEREWTKAEWYLP
jgi:NADPH-dependent 2,4-dienoyl-CoA reductase/sulfur reductase-like enzyme